MANVTVRNQGTTQPAAMQRREWDPISWARQLLGWDPFREVAPVSQFEALSYVPAFEVKETKDAFEFKADLPGVLEKDLEVGYAANRLTITGKREAEKEEKNETYYACERSFGSFVRSFTLPEGIDYGHITARMKDGVLTIIVPKKPEAQARKIPVSTMETPGS